MWAPDWKNGDKTHTRALPSSARGKASWKSCIEDGAGWVPASPPGLPAD